MNSPNTDDIRGLDGIRALACLWVFGHHVCLGYMGLDSNLIRFFAYKGSAGVAIFLILSGFLLAGPFWNSVKFASPLPKLKSYIFRRWARIWPGFALCLVLTAVFAPNHQEWLTREVIGLAFLNWVFPPYFMLWENNEPLWSVPMEWVCYLLLPAVMVWAKRLHSIPKSIAALLILCLLFVLLQSFLFQMSATYAFDSGMTKVERNSVVCFFQKGPIAMIPFFLFGIMARGIYFEWIRGKQEASTAKRKRSDLICAASVFGILLSLFPNTLKYFTGLGNDLNLANAFFLNSMPYYFPWFAIFMSVFIAFCPASHYFGILLNHRVLRYIGRISFGIYLWHYPILISINKVTLKFGFDEKLSLLSLALCGLGLSICAGEISWRFVEKPMIRFAKSF